MDSFTSQSQQKPGKWPPSQLIFSYTDYFLTLFKLVLWFSGLCHHWPDWGPSLMGWKLYVVGVLSSCAQICWKKTSNLVEIFYWRIHCVFCWSLEAQ